VSSVTLIPVLYGTIAGTGVAYAAMLARERAAQPAMARRGASSPYSAGGDLGGVGAGRAR
jgi:hypothetical protein